MLSKFGNSVGKTPEEEVKMHDGWLFDVDKVIPVRNLAMRFLINH